MSHKRRVLRAQKRNDKESLEHLLKVTDMAKALIKNKVLKVFQQEKKALLPADIWNGKEDSFKRTFTKNMALYILSLNAKEDDEAVMEVELYDFDYNLLASYKDKKVKIY